MCVCGGVIKRKKLEEVKGEKGEEREREREREEERERERERESPSKTECPAVVK